MTSIFFSNSLQTVCTLFKSTHACKTKIKQTNKRKQNNNNKNSNNTIFFFRMHALPKKEKKKYKFTASDTHGHHSLLN